MGWENCGSLMQFTNIHFLVVQSEQSRLGYITCSRCSFNVFWMSQHICFCFLVSRYSGSSIMDASPLGMTQALAAGSQYFWNFCIINNKKHLMHNGTFFLSFPLSILLIYFIYFCHFLHNLHISYLWFAGYCLFSHHPWCKFYCYFYNSSELWNNVGLHISVEQLQNF